MPELAMTEHRAALLAQCPLARRHPDADRQPIHVTRWGESGPAVVVIHGGVQGGLGGGPATFSRQEALAREGWQLLLPDRPGFGQSPSRGPDDMEADAHWIADMLGTGAHLIGHSWGGATALLAAARRPDAVRSLILIEPALLPLMAGAPELKSNVAAQADAARMAGLLRKAQSPGEYAMGFARSLGALPGRGGVANQAAAALENDPERATAVGCALLQGRMASPDAMRASAATVAAAEIPVLAVTGGWSPCFDVVGTIVARLTSGRHQIVSSPNHFVQLANAADFNSAVAAFMSTAEPL